MTWEKLLAIVYLLGWLVTIVAVYVGRYDEDGYALHDSDGEALGEGLFLGALWPLVLAMLAVVLPTLWAIDKILDPFEPGESE